MRIRSIRPEFWTSEDVAALDWHARLVYIGLWSYVDDNGVGRDVEALVTAALFPLDDDFTEASLRVHGALKALQAGGQITRYKVAGKPYLHVTQFLTHQKINRPSDGRYPLPTCENAEPHVALTEPSVSPQADAPLGEGEKGRRGEGEKGPRAARRATPLPADFAVTDPMRAWAAENAPGVDIDIATTKFINHAHANGRTLKDWAAGWRNWLLNEKPARGARPTPTEQFMQTVAIGQRIAAETEALAVNGYRPPPRGLRAVPEDDIDQYELPDVWTGGAR